jgi:Clathrin-binding box of Aftiphilin, vesicle trafficking
MFPGVDETEASHQMSRANFELEMMKTNNLLLTDLVDFEASKALAYQYSNSKSSHSLLRALSIDTRNIVSAKRERVLWPRP